MNIEIDSGGRVAFSALQQRWRDPNGEDGTVIQTARFAGQEMMAISDDAGGFDLHFLNFKAGGFKTMNDAMKAAPEFAKRVLARMTEMVAS
jgi:hypothetical protein